MLSIEQCTKILEQHGGKYTYEQVKEIRDILYSFGALDYEVFKTKKIQHESNNLHPRINGRTG